jgi:molybdopterin synthase catalytic subunit
MKRASIVTAGIEASALIARVRTNEHGAVVSFLGTVRDTNDGRNVTGLEYSSYVAMAEEEIERILVECEARFGVSSTVVEHRIGQLAVGDVSIAIVAAHEHREPALDATRYVIDEIKRRVPIWKRERYTDGSLEWVDPTQAVDQAGV